MRCQNSCGGWRIIGLIGLCVLCGCGQEKKAWKAPPPAPAPTTPAKVEYYDDPTLSELTPADPQDWPGWRGIGGLGHAAENANPPIRWSERDVRWKTPIAGRGHSSPCVSGELIFLSTAHQDSAEVLAIDRQTGTERWRTEVFRGSFPGMHAKNSHASATGACDGERVFFLFDVIVDNQAAILATALSRTGEIVWQATACSFAASNGYGSSPVLHKGLFIIAADSSQQSCLLALDRVTGKPVWRSPRGQAENYATPIIANLNGRDQLLIHGMHHVSSFDPQTGQPLWSVPGIAQYCANTMAWSGDRIFASGGSHEKVLMSVQVKGERDVPQAELAWTSGKGVCYVPSLLTKGDRLFTVEDDGVASCVEATTGKFLWSHRLGGAVTASPVLAGERIYLVTEAGKVIVFKAADKYEELAANQLGEEVYATPALAHGMIFIRSMQHLYGIGGAP